MAATIKLKRSNTGSSVPGTGTLAFGELAINTADRKLYSSTNGSDIVEVGGQQYNLTSDAVTLSGGLTGAGINLTTDDGNDTHVVDLLSSESVTVTRNANGAITFSSSLTGDFATDSGTAEPSSGAVTITGGAGIATSGSGSTVTVGLDIDGMTATTTVVDGDLFIVDDGANGTNKKITGTTLKTYLGLTAGASSISNLDIIGGTDIVTPTVNDNLIIADADASDAPKRGDIGSVLALINSGDVTVSATGQSTIGAGTVENAMLAGSIANNKLTNSTVSFGGVSLALGASDATPAFDLTDATNYPASSLTGTITNAQLAGSIANSKLTNGSITVSDGSNDSAIALGGTLTFAGTANEVEVAENAGTITVGLPNNVTIAGNLTVSGTTTTINTDVVTIEDGSLKLASNQTASGADAIDFGFYGTYNVGGTQKFAGLLRDQNGTNQQFILFENNSAEPGTTLNTGGAGHQLAHLDAIIDGGTY